MGVTIPAIITIAVSFLVTLFALPFWIRRALARDFVGIDVHKKGKYKVAELGGLIVVFGAVIGLLFYVAVRVFYYKDSYGIVFILSAVASILIAAIIGIVDDILGWKIGLRQRQKVILSLLAALPLVVANAGHSKMNIPLLGIVDFSYAYPILLIPLAVVGASNGFNMLAGFNGLEAGMAVLQLGALGYISWISSARPAAIIAACMLAAVLAFWLFNRYPARVFPGDTFTYSVGASIAVVAILGNVEKFALILFIPYFIELALKARGGFRKESFAKVLSDGSLANRYSKWYSLTHVAVSLLRKIKGRASEDSVVLLLLSLEAVIAISTFAYFFG